MYSIPNGRNRFFRVRHSLSERINVAVIGQHFPYTPIANPQHWLKAGPLASALVEFRRMLMRREKGAEIVVLLSHNGFDVDQKIAAELTGIVHLTGHTQTPFQSNKN